PGHGRGRYPRPPAMDATRAALQAGGSVLSLSLRVMRSSGLMTSLIVLVATKRGGVEPGMPQQDLDHPNVGVLFQKMRRKAVTERVRGHRLADLRHVSRGMAGPPELARRHRIDRIHSGK